ncbi:MAG: hypothetical protein AAFY77_06155 [Pseudomonadota bacterium]
MTGKTATRILLYLGRFDRRLAAVARDLRVLNLRPMSLQAQVVPVKCRLGRFDDRDGRIEKRLDLVEG